MLFQKFVKQGNKNRYILVIQTTFPQAFNTLSDQIVLSQSYTIRSNSVITIIIHRQIKQHRCNHYTLSDQTTLSQSLYTIRSNSNVTTIIHHQTKHCQSLYTVTSNNIAIIIIVHYMFLMQLQKKSLLVICNK